MSMAKLDLKPEPRKKVFLAVAVTPEMREALKVELENLPGMTMSGLMRALAQKFLNGDFDKIEDIKTRRSSRKQNKRANKPRNIGGEA